MITLLFLALALSPSETAPFEMSLSETDLTIGEVTLVSEGYKFAEGPVWIPGEGLIFSDVRDNTVYRSDHEVFRSPSEGTNGMVLDEEGRLLSCESKLQRITRREADGSMTVLAEKYEGKAFNTTNDIAVRSDGLVYFTDPGKTSKSELSHNGVYVLDPKNGDVRLLSTTARYPNGIGLSPDEKTLYVADYMGVKIRAYTVAEDGSVSNERDFAEVLNPDGFAVDAEGRLWVASRKGIMVLDAQGQQVAMIEVRTPTNCSFGGPEGNVLFITARSKLFKVETNAKGVGTF